MPTTIKLKNSVTTTNAPSSLAQGEVAINITDKKVWVGNAATTPIQLLGAGSSGTFGALTCTSLTNSGLTSGRVTYATTAGLLTDSAGLTFDGTNFATTGTATATRFIPSGSTIATNGMYLPAANSIGISTNSTNAIYIDSSQNVGIGTTSPSFFAGGGLQVSNATQANLRLSDTTNAAYNFDLFMNDADAYAVNRTSGPIVFGTNNTERMRITSSGDVGIGTSSPSAKLQVVGNVMAGNGTAATPAYHFVGSSAIGMFTPDAGFSVAFSTGSTERMRIDSSGNVGIGTTSPTFASGGGLQVKGSGFTSVRLTSASSTGVDFSQDTSSNGYMYNRDNAALIYGTNNTERMRITSGGDLLIGKTSYSSTVNGFQFGPADNGANIGLLSITGNSTNAGATAYQLYSTSNSTFRFYVNYAGTIFAQSTTISGISDQRLKENIVDLDVGLDAVMALKPRKFDWKEGKGKDIKGDRGFVAQEFETVFPDLIDEWKDPSPEGEEPYKSVRADLIPVLVKAIQEQQAMIEELKQEVAKLKGV